MLSSNTEIRVRYEETDQMGMVYHAKYFNWFEVARIKLLDVLDLTRNWRKRVLFVSPILLCDI